MNARPRPSGSLICWGEQASTGSGVAAVGRGSLNQIVHHPSGHYSDLEIEERNEVEFVISEDGKLSMFGYPNAEIRAWATEI